MCVCVCVWRFVYMVVLLCCCVSMVMISSMNGPAALSVVSTVQHGSDEVCVCVCVCVCFCVYVCVQYWCYAVPSFSQTFPPHLISVVWSPVLCVSCGHQSSVCVVWSSVLFVSCGHLCCVVTDGHWLDASVLCGHRSSVCVVWSPVLCGHRWAPVGRTCVVCSPVICVSCSHLCCVVTDWHRLDASVLCAHRSSVCRVVTCVGRCQLTDRAVLQQWVSLSCQNLAFSPRPRHVVRSF